MMGCLSMNQIQRQVAGDFLIALDCIRREILLSINGL